MITIISDPNPDNLNLIEFRIIGDTDTWKCLQNVCINQEKELCTRTCLCRTIVHSRTVVYVGQVFVSNSCSFENSGCVIVDAKYLDYLYMLILLVFFLFFFFFIFFFVFFFPNTV